MAVTESPESSWQVRSAVSREAVVTVTLMAVTAIVLWVCYQIISPFLPALAWALALAVVAHPVNRWLRRILKRNDLAALATVLLVALMVMGPLAFVAQQITHEITVGIQTLRDEAAVGGWRSLVERNPHLGRILRWIEQNINLQQHAETAIQNLAKQASGFLTTSIGVIAQWIITLFSLFYIFRDQEQVLAMLRRVVPLSDAETTEVFRRISDSIHAAVFGTLMVSLAQGTLGGLMFWLLGLPTPLLWGLCMAVFAMIPTMGAPVIWIPAAVILALSGHWVKAVILAAWGALAVGLIDNFLYPILVGQRMRLHPLPIFFSVIGGVMLFGGSGIVLGPVTLSVADALIELWRRRTAGATEEVGSRSE